MPKLTALVSQIRTQLWETFPNKGAGGEPYSGSYWNVRDHSSYGCTVVSLLESLVASECRTIVAEGVVALLCVLKEADYEDPAFQVSHWGEATYARLLRLKKLYDPDGLFICHHCVGSELWSADGNCRL